MLRLGDDISKLKGIGAKKREKLNDIGIHNVFDLLEYYPIRYRDKRFFVTSDCLVEGRDQLIIGRLVKKSNRSYRRGSLVLECTFSDEKGYYNVVFFNMPYLSKTLTLNDEFVVFGKMTLKNGMKVFYNPELYPPDSVRNTRGIIPVYRQTKGITSNEISKWMHAALDEVDIDEWLREGVAKDRGLLDEKSKYINIHFPKDDVHYRYAKYRNNYDSLYMYLLAIRESRTDNYRDELDASIPEVDISVFVSQLPFRLTAGQQQAVNDICEDLGAERPMNRLLQGDVGSGKTVVAEAAIYRVAKAGYQSAFMAPTEILAVQHYNNVARDLEPYGISVALLSSSSKAKERREVLRGLETGEIDVVIGTHALIQESVVFNNLGLVVTDEQHRFGVNQRKNLRDKSRAANVLVMSATPIPRTLANTVFGDMDFSIIRTKPASRKTIITRALSRNSRNIAYRAVITELESRNKAFVVAPSIDEDEDNELASTEKLYKELKSKFKDYRVGLIHGRMSREEKDSVMLDFAQGDMDVLVSTVVIEVGIDVPGATIIVIENSDRFGLAQLHQLRGRVGRNDKQSYCYLINYSNSETSQLRMEALVKFSDGFDIAEEDFRLRGPGNIMGTMQHGQADSNLLNIMRNEELLRTVQSDVDNHSEDSDSEFVRLSLANIYGSDYSSTI